MSKGKRYPPPNVPEGFVPPTPEEGLRLLKEARIDHTNWNFVDGPVVPMKSGRFVNSDLFDREDDIADYRGHENA